MSHQRRKSGHQSASVPANSTHKHNYRSDYKPTVTYGHNKKSAYKYDSSQYIWINAN
jgi:hypothetical protein